MKNKNLLLHRNAQATSKYPLGIVWIINVGKCSTNQQLILD